MYRLSTANENNFRLPGTWEHVGLRSRETLTVHNAQLSIDDRRQLYKASICQNIAFESNLSAWGPCSLDIRLHEDDIPLDRVV
jgi:hypothetical protein